MVRDSKRFGRCSNCAATLIFEEPTPTSETSSAAPGKPQEPRSRASTYGEILSGRILDARGNEVESLSLQEEALIETLYRFLIAGVDVVTHVAVWAETNKAFHWHAEFRVEEAGIYRVAVRLPPSLLAEKRYILRISAQLELGEESARISLRPAPAFKAVGPENDFTRRDGAVRPDLDWELVRVGAPHEVPEHAAG